jgi:hypothetical protein
MKSQVPELAKILVTEYAQQSVSIENNPLNISDSMEISEFLAKKLFSHVNIGAVPAERLAQLPLPQFSPNKDDSAVNELKNHIVASRWIAETGAAQSGTSGLNEAEMRQLSAMTIRGTESEEIYAKSWGGRVALGGYRKLPIRVTSNPLRIFLYPEKFQPVSNASLPGAIRNTKIRNSIHLSLRPN